MENLDIKHAKEFLKSVGYTWNGKIGKNCFKTICDFDYPQIIKLNNEEKGLILYNEQDNQPECIIYSFEKHGNSYLFAMEKNLTSEWADYLKRNIKWKLKD